MDENLNGLAQQDVEAYRHNCEVRYVVAKYRSQGSDSVKRYLLLVEKARGNISAQRLRNDALNLLKGDSHGNKT
jgi:hypothetical protein